MELFYLLLVLWLWTQWWTKGNLPLFWDIENKYICPKWGLYDLCDWKWGLLAGRGTYGWFFEAVSYPCNNIENYWPLMGQKKKKKNWNNYIVGDGMHIEHTIWPLNWEDTKCHFNVIFLKWCVTLCFNATAYCKTLEISWQYNSAYLKNPTFCCLFKYTIWSTILC